MTEDRETTPVETKGPGASATATSPAVSPPRVDRLPPFKVLLHNDDKNEVTHVVRTIMELTPLNKQEAETRTLEAHNSGVALLLVTHRERAELYRDQFRSKRLNVSIEAGE